MVDVTDQISHEHEKKNFFTRWFMSTNHKDIGILYIFTAALLGFVAVAFRADVIIMGIFGIHIRNPFATLANILRDLSI